MLLECKDNGMNWLAILDKLNRNYKDCLARWSKIKLRIVKDTNDYSTVWTPELVSVLYGHVSQQLAGLYLCFEFIK